MAQAGGSYNNPLKKFKYVRYEAVGYCVASMGANQVLIDWSSWESKVVRRIFKHHGVLVDNVS